MLTSLFRLIRYSKSTYRGLKTWTFIISVDHSESYIVGILLYKSGDPNSNAFRDQAVYVNERWHQQKAIRRGVVCGKLEHRCCI